MADTLNTDAMGICEILSWSMAMQLNLQEGHSTVDLEYLMEVDSVSLRKVTWLKPS